MLLLRTFSHLAYCHAGRIKACLTAQGLLADDHLQRLTQEQHVVGGSARRNLDSEKSSHPVPPLLVVLM